MQQGDKVLPLYQKQLQRGEKVLEQEISSSEFSLPFFLLRARQQQLTPSSDHAGIFTPGCGTIRNLHPCLWRPCRVCVRVTGVLHQCLCLQGNWWCLPNSYVLHGGKLAVEE